MKKMNRLLALCLAMLMMLSTAAWAEETTTEETAADPVVFTFNGEDVLRSQLENTLYNLYSNGYVTSETDYATAIDYMLEEKVILTQIKAQGLDQFTQEEEDAFKADAMADWEATIDSYVSYFLSEDTDEARAKARQDGDAYLRSYGYTPEMLIEGYRNTAAFEKLQEKIFEGKNTEATEEEIVEVFEQYAAEDKAMYEGDFATYELYQNYGYTSWYKPEGFRGIIHILLEVDEELLTAYENAQALYEESLSAEEGAAAAVIGDDDGLVPADARVALDVDVHGAAAAHEVVFVVDLVAAALVRALHADQPAHHGADLHARVQRHGHAAVEGVGPGALQGRGGADLLPGDDVRLGGIAGLVAAIGTLGIDGRVIEMPKGALLHLHDSTLLCCSFRGVPLALMA